ncbi:MAG: TraR/DksA C4-type zinc finger protein [Actinomycetota bacterium]
MEEEVIRKRLGELQEELQRRSVRRPGSARTSASRGTNVAALEDVERATRMLEKGTYGICEACGLPIPAERLEVNPAARFCLEDQQSNER